MKRNKILLTFGILSVVLFSLSSCGNRLKGSNAFMFKTTGNHFGEAIMSGFGEVMERNNEKYFDKSPSEANVGSQVQMIETLTMQQVKSITISASGTTGYDEVLKRAVAKGIKVVSTDSPASPKYRVTHVEHTRTNEVGKWLARAATLIACGVDYGDPNEEAEWDNNLLLRGPVKNALDKRIDLIHSATGEDDKPKQVKFGILSSTQDSPSQNEWIKFIQKELQNSDDEELNGLYSEALIDTNPDILYGDDEAVKSTEKANIFIERNVDVIIAPTTVGMAAAATAIKDRKVSNVKLTGLGMPSECYGTMPTGINDPNPDCASVCPYMMLWDVIELGKVAAKVAIEAAKGNYNGDVGDTFEFDPNGDGKTQTYTTENSEDGGTKVVALKPLPFTRYNIEVWKEIL